MYNDLLKPPPDPMGAPPAIKGVQAPVIAAPPGTKTLDQEKYHRQRLDLLNKLRDIHNSGKDEWDTRNPEAQNALSTLLSIYSKLPLQKASLDASIMASGSEKFNPNEARMMDDIGRVAPTNYHGWPTQISTKEAE